MSPVNLRCLIQDSRYVQSSPSPYIAFVVCHVVGWVRQSYQWCASAGAFPANKAQSFMLLLMLHAHPSRRKMCKTMSVQDGDQCARPSISSGGSLLLPLHVFPFFFLWLFLFSPLIQQAPLLSSAVCIFPEFDGIVSPSVFKKEYLQCTSSAAAFIKKHKNINRLSLINKPFSIFSWQPWASLHLFHCALSLSPSLSLSLSVVFLSYLFWHLPSTSLCVSPNSAASSVAQHRDWHSTVSAFEQCSLVCQDSIFLRCII